MAEAEAVTEWLFETKASRDIIYYLSAGVFLTGEKRLCFRSNLMKKSIVVVAAVRS